MIKNVALFTVAIVTACACASSNAQAPECPKAGGLKLTVGNYHLDLNEHKPICVTAPGIFKIKIKTQANSDIVVEKGDATVEQKACSGISISGNNADAADKITVVINGNAEENYECEFLIDIKNLGTLDPKVRVIGDQMMFSLQADAVYDLLDTLDISLEEANKLRPPEGLE
jgi:hypothetical protein